MTNTIKMKENDKAVETKMEKRKRTTSITDRLI